jgi:hypothetical protein
LAGLDGSGSLSWGFGYAGCDVTGAVADATRGASFTGTCAGAVDFGAGPVGNPGVSNAFLHRRSNAGAAGFAQVFTGTADTQTFGGPVATDTDGEIAFMGRLDGDASFGGTVLSNPQVPVDGGSVMGPKALVLAKFDAQGQHLWSHNHGTSGDQVGVAAAFDGKGNAVFGGHFSGKVDFGSGDLVSAGGHDLFLAKFGP